MASSRKSSDSPSVAPISLGEDATERGIDASGTVASGQSEYALFTGGMIDFDRFLEMSVDRALSPLGGAMSSERLELMREVLRSQLEHDPHLSALAAQATGS